jgi:hypothetical protein
MVPAQLQLPLLVVLPEYLARELVVEEQLGDRNAWQEECAEPEAVAVSESEHPASFQRNRALLLLLQEQPLQLRARLHDARMGYCQRTVRQELPSPECAVEIRFFLLRHLQLVLGVALILLFAPSFFLPFQAQLVSQLRFRPLLPLVRRAVDLVARRHLPRALAVHVRFPIAPFLLVPSPTRDQQHSSQIAVSRRLVQRLSHFQPVHLVMMATREEDVLRFLG